MPHILVLGDCSAVTQFMHFNDYHGCEILFLGVVPTTFNEQKVNGRFNRFLPRTVLDKSIKNAKQIFKKTE